MSWVWIACHSSLRYVTVGGSAQAPRSDPSWCPAAGCPGWPGAECRLRAVPAFHRSSPGWPRRMRGRDVDRVQQCQRIGCRRIGCRRCGQRVGRRRAGRERRARAAPGPAAAVRCAATRPAGRPQSGIGDIPVRGGRFEVHVLDGRVPAAARPWVPAGRARHRRWVLHGRRGWLGSGAGELRQRRVECDGLNAGGGGSSDPLGAVAHPAAARRVRRSRMPGAGGSSDSGRGRRGLRAAERPSHRPAPLLAAVARTGRRAGAEAAIRRSGPRRPEVRAAVTTLRGVAPDSPVPQTGHAPRPWVASTRSATAICSSLVARCAAGAYSPPPCDLQVPGENCSPPWYPLPVLIAQLPPDSQRATLSHSPSVAAPACPARARPPLPMTAPVKATFATVTADAVGLRCRPLMGALGPL